MSGISSPPNDIATAPETETENESDRVEAKAPVTESDFMRLSLDLIDRLRK